jgi:ribose 5-phosphate isomerase B
MKIAIASDHAGFEYKALIIKHLEANHSLTDFGTKSLDSVDYPDFIHPCADAVEQKSADLGIIVCGSGNGAQITANKHQGIRAALCWNTELAALARQHNDANVISIPSRFVSEAVALEMVDTFLSTAFEGGRHQDRVNKIKCC